MKMDPSQLLNIPTITTDQMREVDRLMIEEYSISLEQMMENAGRNLADFAIEILSSRGIKKEPYKIIVACGTGNNGGGGMVAARFLSNRENDVTVVLTGKEDRLKPVAAQRWRTLKKLPVTTILVNSSAPLLLFKDADLIIDAIIGYGLQGAPRGIQAHIIQEILNSGNPMVLSLDVPSGLDSTTGSTKTICIRAQATMTLALPKTGLIVAEAAPFVGDLYVADIGVPPKLYTRIGLQPQLLFKNETILPLNKCDIDDLSV